MGRFLRASLLALAILPAACGSKNLLIPVLVRGDGGSGVASRPDFDVLLRFTADATDFDPLDVLRISVNGVDRTPEVRMGGDYALLRISPSPLGVQFVEIARRLGPVTDTFTWDLAPYAGPTVASVTPPSARVGTQVVIAGQGLAAGTPRVFFGGVEGTVDASSGTSITATVPAGALPGLLFVLVGADAAEGVVEFQPLDASDLPVPQDAGPRLFAVFNARGPRETAVKLYGIGFDDEDFPKFSDEFSTRVFGIETVPLPLVGEVLSAYAVVSRDAPPGAGGLFLVTDDGDTNELPFTVD